MTATEPESVQGPGHAQCPRDLAPVFQIAQRCSEILVLTLQLSQPYALIRSDQGYRGLFCEPGEKGRVTIANGIAAIGASKAVVSVVPNRIQQTEPRWRSGGVRKHE